MSASIMATTTAMIEFRECHIAMRSKRLGRQIVTSFQWMKGLQIVPIGETEITYPEAIASKARTHRVRTMRKKAETLIEFHIAVCTEMTNCTIDLGTMMKRASDMNAAALKVEKEESSIMEEQGEFLLRHLLHHHLQYPPTRDQIQDINLRVPSPKFEE